MPALSALPGSLAQRLPHTGRPRRPDTATQGLRRRRPGDVGACVRLAGLSSAHGVHQPSWRAWLESDAILDAWVVERRGEILGHVAIAEVGRDAVSAMRWREITGHASGDLLAVSRLFVRRRVRNQGLGTALLETAVAEIRKRGRIPVAEAVGCGPEEYGLYDEHGKMVGMYPASQRADGRDAFFFVLR